MESGEAIDYLAYSERSGLGHIITAMQDETPSRPAPNIVFTSHLAATLLKMARAGVGVAWLPATLDDDDLRMRHLVTAAGPQMYIPVEIRLFRPVARQSEVVESAWAVMT